MGWLPIETAPVGVDVLFFCSETDVAWTKRSIGQARIKVKGSGEAITEYLFRVGNQLLRRGTAHPTHWQPLPAPPEA